MRTSDNRMPVKDAVIMRSPQYVISTNGEMNRRIIKEQRSRRGLDSKMIIGIRIPFGGGQSLLLAH